MSRPHSCGNAGVSLLCQLFVRCLPLRGHHAEEVEISCSGIADRAGPATRDECDLPGMHRCGPGTNIHIAASFEDIVQFRRIFQDMGGLQHLAGRSCGQCCSGAAVHQGRCRGEVFSRERTVNDPAAVTVSDSADDHEGVFFKNRL